MKILTSNNKIFLIINFGRQMINFGRPTNNKSNKT